MINLITTASYHCSKHLYTSTHMTLYISTNFLCSSEQETATVTKTSTLSTQQQQLFHTTFSIRVGHSHSQGSRRDQEFKRREVELDPQVSPEEIMSKEVELGCESWTSFASSCSSTAVQWTLSLWLPSIAVETAIAQCANTSIVLVAVHGLYGLFRAVSAVQPSLFHPPTPTPPSLSPFLASHLASVDVKQNVRVGHYC